jgi:hypothetical protein
MTDATPPAGTYDRLHEQSKVVIDAAIFLSICRDRFEGMRLPADVGRPAMEQYIAHARETYAQDMASGTMKYFNWRDGGRIIRSAADIQSHRDGTSLPIDDVVELLGNLPYPDTRQQRS